MASPHLVWVLESEVFPATHAALRDAIRHAGQQIIDWSDDWWSNGGWPQCDDCAVVFHGSLGNAARIRPELPWQPGAFCDAAAFHCSAWYPRAEQWLLHRHYQILPAAELTADPSAVLGAFGNPSHVFIRPDSPLKPFSGRVLAADQITLPRLDHGFYYDDARIPVVATPVRSVQREWRYIVVNRQVVAGSAYSAESRSAAPVDSTGRPWAFACEIAEALAPPEDVYVLDICEADNQLWLLELNPFSGADLYSCNPAAIVTAVSSCLNDQPRRGDTT